MTVRNRIPGFLNQIQFLKFYAFNPCDAPFMLYIETALPIAGKIAIMLLELDFVGFVKTLIRPKWVRSWRKVARGQKPRRRRGGIPEPGDLIADKLDPHRYLRVPTWTFAGNTLIQIHDTYERVFWTIFLVDVIEGFIFDTIIGVIEADKSGCPHIGRLLREDTSVIVTGVGDRWVGINVQTLRYINNASSSGGTGMIPFEGEWVMTFGCWFTAQVFDTTNVRFRLRNFSTGEIYDEAGPFDIALGESKEVVISANVKALHNCTWEVNVGFGNIRMFDLVAFGMQIAE